MLWCVCGEGEGSGLESGGDKAEEFEVGFGNTCSNGGGKRGCHGIVGCERLTICGGVGVFAFCMCVELFGGQEGGRSSLEFIQVCACFGGV